jgi:hypothetical protein
MAFVDIAMFCVLVREQFFSSLKQIFWSMILKKNPFGLYVGWKLVNLVIFLFVYTK